MDQSLSIIVPVYNEERTIQKVIKQLLDLKLKGWEKQIIVINDGSTDKTEEKLKKYSSRIIYDKNQLNIGKGRAIKTGLKHASGKVVIIQDADLEYNPKDILELIKHYDSKSSVAVYGSRRLGSKRKGYFFYVLGDSLANFLFSFIFRQSTTDIFTGYKVVKTSLLKKMELKSKGFEVEMEVTKWLIKQGFKIKEVPISYNPRTFTQGKKLGLIKGFSLFCSIFKFR